MPPNPATVEHDPAQNIAEPKARLADFDEQLWPVNLLLLALAALLAGLIWTRDDFHAQEPWTNGYVHLGILGAIVAVWGLAALLMRRGDQRRMQLAVLASLLLHVWLSVGMHQYQLPMVASLHPQAAARALDRALPDYHFHQLEHPSEKQFFEKPLESDAAPRIDPQAHEHRVPVSEVVPASQPAADNPLKPAPRPIEIQRADASAPHRGERLPGPQKSASQKLAEPQPAVIDRRQPAASDQLPSAPDSPEPATGRDRPAAELEPRVAMSRSPRTESWPELKAAPAAGARSRIDAPPAAVSVPPAAGRPARSSTRDRLDPQDVPISPVVPAPGAGPGDSRPQEIEPTAGRAARSDAAAFTPPPGLPLANPGFEGPTMPLGTHISGDSGGSTVPEFEQPALSRPTRARREDLPLASDDRVAGAARRSATSARQPGPSGEFEANLAPRARNELELPLNPSGPAPDGSNEEPSLGHLPGAPVIPEAESAAILSPAAAPAPGVPLRKHSSDALVG
ncbi:MAG TPA: hypothetical protein VHY20_03155, partial [Pirellulales bacterium]|nr:hypothetical protein [Pirellulales bacterium]